MEIEKLFKSSKISICHNCYNVNEKCSIATEKICDTDSKTRMSFVKSCNRFNRPFVFESYIENTVSVQALQDSRIDTIGGGFHNIEKYS